MKNKTSQQVKVGMFVGLGLVLSMLAIFLLGDLGGILERQYTLYSRFQDISGLRVGAPVFLAGINVGKVEGIQFPQKLEEKEVVVTLKIHKEYQDRIRDDSMASVVTQGLLGDKAVFVTVGSPQHQELKNKMELKAKQGFSLDSFSEQGSELLENVNELAKNINSIIKDAKTNDSLIHAVLYDSEGKKIIQNISRMIDSVQGIVGEIRNGKGVLHALIYDPTKQNVGEKFSKTVENFEVVSANLKSVSDTIKQGKGSIGGLIHDPTVYYNLMTLLGNANRNKLLRTVIRATLATNEKDLTKGE